MAKPRPTITKRIREKARLEKRMKKEEKKAERDAQKEYERQDRPADAHHDPDIADIVPGPQRPVWHDGSC